MIDLLRRYRRHLLMGAALGLLALAALTCGFLYAYVRLYLMIWLAALAGRM